MKIAVVGCGRQAVKHVAGLRKCRDVQIVLVDKLPELARRLADKEGLPWVETVEEVLGDPEVRAVDLCVPTPYHTPLILDALAAQKDFFCEKPLSATAAEAREINERAAQAGRLGVVGYVYRHAPVFRQARAILEGAAETGKSPVIGTISTALMRIGGRGSAAVWKHRRNDGGGAINEMLVHMLDLAIWYFGPAERAELFTSDLLRPQRTINGKMETADAEDFVLARFWMRSGVPVVIEADLLTPSFSQAIEVQGDNGTLVASIQPEMPQYVFTLSAANGYAQGRTTLTADESNFFDAQMADFVACLRETPRREHATLTDSVHVMRALELLKSSRP